MSIPTEVLKAADLLAGLTPEQAEIVAALGKRQTYHKDDVIMHAGEAGNELCIVLKGQTEVVTGEEIPDSPASVFLGEGQGFGEMSVLDAGPRSATIHCASDEAEILIIPGKALLEFCGRDRTIGYQLMYNIARDLAFKLRIRNLALQRLLEEKQR